MMTTLPTPRTLNEARTLANIAQRAKTLFSTGGYTWRRGELLSGPYYRVTTPDGTEYICDMLLETCDCPCFKKRQTCKHWLAILEVDADLKADTQYEADGGDEACFPYLLDTESEQRLWGRIGC